MAEWLRRNSNLLEEGFDVELIEAVGDDSFRCIFLKAGRTKTANAYGLYNGRKVPVFKNYLEPTVKEAVEAGLFEGVPILLRTEQQHLSQTNDSVLNQIGTLFSTKWNDEKKGGEGIVKFKKGSEKAANFLAETKKLMSGIKSVRLSFTGKGKWDVKQIGNEFVADVTKIKEVFSVDPCSMDNAGGEFIGLSESAISDNPNNYFYNSSNQSSTMKPQQRKALFDWLVKQGKLSATAKLEDYATKDDELMALVTVPEFHKIMADVPADPPPPPAKTAAELEAERIEKERKEKEEKEKTPEQKELEALKTEVQETMAENRKMLAESTISKKIESSKLPASAKGKIKSRHIKLVEENYKNKDWKFSESALDDELKDTAELLAESGGGFKFAGGGNFQQGVDPVDRFTMAMRAVVYSPLVIQSLSEAEKKEFKDAGVDLFGKKSIAKLYADMTGDTDITGIYKPEYLSEAGIITTSFTQMFGNTIHRASQKEFALSPYNQDWRKLVTIVPRTDFKDNTLVSVGGYGDLPVVPERQDYTTAETPSEEAIKYSLNKKGYIEDWTMEAMRNDDMKFLQRIPQKFGRAAARTLYKFVFNLILTNPTMLYDATPLFDVLHKNLINGTLDEANLIAIKSLMHNQKELDTDEPLGIVPKYMLISEADSAMAYKLITPAFNQANDVPTYAQTLRLEPIVVAHQTSRDVHFVANPMDNPTIEIGFLDGREEPEIFLADNPVVGYTFTKDVISLKIRHIYNGGLENHRSFGKLKAA